jgi:hypothetical protein
VKQILKDYLDEDDVDEAVLGPETPDVIMASAVDATPAPAPASVAPAAPAAPASPASPEKQEVVESKKADEADVVDLDEKPVVIKSAMKEPDSTAAAAPPSVVNIETEPTVTFSSYDDVFDEAKGAPELRYTPKDGGEDEDDESLSINEGSAAPLSVEDVEDLDAPVEKPKPKAPAPVIVKKETIDEDDVEVLE